MAFRQFRACSGRTRETLASAPSTATDGCPISSHEVPSKPSMIAVASSSVNNSGGSLKPGRSRYPRATDRWPGLKQFEHSEDATSGMVHDNPLLSVIFNIYSQTRTDPVLLQWYIIKRRHVKQDSDRAESLPYAEQEGNGVEQMWLAFHHSKEHKGEMRHEYPTFSSKHSPGNP